MNTLEKHKAVDYLMAGHSCSQSMIMAYCHQFDISEQTAARLATGFAGGLAQGNTCGAVTGAIMVAGLKFGSGVAWDRYANEYCALVTQEFCHRFRHRQKTIECRKILKMNKIDPKDPEQIKGLRESGLCKEIVTDAQEILDQLLEEGV